MNLKEILYQSKQLIDSNKYEHPTVTLATTFLKSAGEANPYVNFGYGPHNIFYHTWVQASGSITADPINMNKTFNNKWW